MEQREDVKMQTETMTDRVACPQCGHESDVQVMPFIDGSDPDQREKFFTGAVNVFRCDSCGTEMMLSSLFEYVDPNLGIALASMPEAAIGHDEFLADFADDGSLLYSDRNDDDLALLPLFLRHRRIVFSYAELLLQAEARILRLVTKADEKQGISLPWKAGDTVSQTVTHTCIACKQPFEQEMIVAADVSAKPELREQLAEQRFNAAPCPHCGQVQLIDSAPILWHDPEHFFSVVYYPFGPDRAAKDGILNAAGMVACERIPGSSSSGFAATLAAFTPHEFYHRFLFHEGLAKRQAEKGPTAPRTVTPLSEEDARKALEARFGPGGEHGPSVN